LSPERSLSKEDGGWMVEIRSGIDFTKLHYDRKVFGHISFLE
jgi:hypothetical protein